MPSFARFIRALFRTPGSALLVIVALGGGIGVTTAMFAITHSLARDLPFESPDRLIYVNRASGRRGIAAPGFTQSGLDEWMQGQSTVEGLAGFSVAAFNVGSSRDGAVRYSGARVSPDAFRLLRVRALRGRPLRREDAAPGAPPVVLLGYGAWRAQFRGDENVVGSTIIVNGEATTVVGVMPDGFEFPFREAVWMPLRVSDATGVADSAAAAFGRLMPGASVMGAREALRVLERRAAVLNPVALRGTGLGVVRFHDHQIEPSDVVLFASMVAVSSLVLVVACANVANLLLLRAAAREREMTVRAALGAGRGRLIAHQLAESFMLAALGAAVGIGVAYLWVTWFNGAVGSRIPYFWMTARLDPIVIAFALGLATVSAVGAGVAPAIHASGVNLSDALREQSRGSRGRGWARLSRALVVTEIALSLALVVAAGLMIRGAESRMPDQLAGVSSAVLTARVELAGPRYATAEARSRFVNALTDLARGDPDVAAFATASLVPGVAAPLGTALLEAGRTIDRVDSAVAGVSYISEDYLRVLAGHAIDGRTFTPGETRRDARVTLVNASFAAHHFAPGMAVGARLRTTSFADTTSWLAVVGVAPDLGAMPHAGHPADAILLPLESAPPASLTVLVRTRGDPLAYLPLLRRHVAALDPELPLFDERTLSRAIFEANVAPRTFATLFAACGAVALTLALVGVYGVVAVATKSRVKEFGIRAALGADSHRLLFDALRGALPPLATGLVAGLALAALIAPLLSSLLVGTDPWSWPIYVGVASLLGVANLIAATIPALGAARADPVLTLRQG
jgi:putative ABC transport system permease protein